MSTPIQVGVSSVAGPIPPPSVSVSALNLTVDHTKQIFSLACEGRHLKERVAREFAKLSSQEVLFSTQAQSTDHKMLASGHLDHFAAYCMILWSEEQSSEAKDKAMEELLNKVSEAWLRTNASLFKHVLDYEAKLDAFLDKAGGWIRVQEEHIWMTMFQITGDTGAPLCASLNIMLHLLDTLPSFPANLSYQSNSPIICGFVPEAHAQPWLGLHSLNLAHTLPLDSRRKAEDVLKEAILCSTGGSTATMVRTGPSISTSTAPKQLGRNAKALPLGGSSLHFFLCSMLSIQVRRHRQVPFSTLLAVRLLLFWHESSASEHRSRGSHSSSSGFIGLGFLDQAVAVGPVMGPQLDLTASAGEEIYPLAGSVRWKCRSPFLEMRPV